MGLDLFSEYSKIRNHFFYFEKTMDKLKSMTIFSAVVEEGSMSGAARRLGVANSVVSKNINELEKWLNRKLIYRSTRNLSLSQEGEIYYKQIQEIIKRVDELEQPEDLDNITLSGVIRLTAPFIFGQKVFGSLLPEFHRLYPGIYINLILNDSFNDMVDEGIDLAIRVSRLPDSNFIARKIGSNRLKLVASLGYIEKFGAPLKPESLNHHVCLIDNSVSNAKRWNFVTPSNENLSVHVNGPIEVNNAESIKALCESGMGLAQLPQIFVEDSIRQGSLIELLPEYSIKFDVSLLYHQKGASSPIVKALIDFLVKNIQPEHLT
jgi:LysR family transcriptional regulator for bpeEF and oprC